MTFKANKYSVRSQDDGVPVNCILFRYEPRPSFNFECPSKGCIIHRCRGEKPTKLEICQTLSVNTCAEPSSRVPECRISVVSVNPSHDNHARIVYDLLDCINRKGDRSDMKSTVNFLTALMRQTSAPTSFLFSRTRQYQPKSSYRNLTLEKRLHTEAL